jgi:Fis family transcriptional regulator, factor for inversion stimulation protein
MNHSFQLNPVKPEALNAQSYNIRDSVYRALNNYFAQLGDGRPAEIYEMVLAEIEIPLLESVLAYTRGNQSKAAIILGLSRGTLRKKLKLYHIE